MRTIPSNKAVCHFKAELGGKTLYMAKKVGEKIYVVRKDGIHECTIVAVKGTMITAEVEKGLYAVGHYSSPQFFKNIYEAQYEWEDRNKGETLCRKD